MKKQLKEQTKVTGILESYKPITTKGPVIGTAIAKGIVGENVVSKNGTYYETRLWEQKTAFGKGGKFFDENGKLKPSTLLGSLDHPMDGVAEMRFENSAIAWRDIWKEDGVWCGEFDILDTPAGHIVKTHLDYAKQTGGGDVFGSSLRAIGEAEEVHTHTESYSRIIPETFELMALDFVYDPSFSNKATLTESTKSRGLLVEQFNRLAKEDKENAKVYKAYAALIKKQPTPINTEAKAVSNAKALYLKTLKAEQINLANLIYDLETLTIEEFKARYKDKDYQKVLKHFKDEKAEVDAEINLIENPEVQLESAEGETMKKVNDKPVDETKVVTEATDLDKALEELGDELDAAEEAEDAAEDAEDAAEDIAEDAEDAAEEVEEDLEAAEDEVEEALEEPTLREVLDAVEGLKAMVEDLKALIEPAEDYIDNQDLDLELELEDDVEEDLADDIEDANVAADLDELTEEDYANMTDEELLALLEK